MQICLSGEPNCFTSSAFEEDEDHAYPAFEYEGLSKQEAFDTLLEVVKAYPPGVCVRACVDT